MQQVRYNGQTSEHCRVTCGVPQGSVLGPVYSLLNTSDVFKIASQHGFQIQGNADDLQLFQSCFPTDMVPLNIRFMGCLKAIQSWMTRNRLNLNATKTEVMWMGSAKRLKNFSPPQVVFADCVFPISSHMRSLGVIIDSAFSFSDHVTRLVNTCFYQLRQIRSVRRSLTKDSAHAIIRALILSRLNYCNSLLSGFPNILLSQVHDVMRAAARLIFQLQYRDHVSHLMRDQLHWLNAASSIRFKQCVQRVNVEMVPRHRISPVVAFQSAASSVDRVCVLLLLVSF